MRTKPPRELPEHRISRQRADIFLVEHGYAATRAEAQAAIHAGGVSANGKRVTRPAQLLPDGAQVDYQPAHPWVSRAGVKLASALDRFALSPANCVCLDVGASTGGFTQVLLQRGAARVYAVDVGHGQLHPKLASNPKLVLLEATDARDLSADRIPEAPQVVTADVSFISLRQALGPALALAAGGAWSVLLIKPQFEGGPNAVQSGGIVRDPMVRETVVAAVRTWFEGQGWQLIGVMESPITGKDGNIEFLLAGRKPG